ncbi:unnamed protein product [Cyprideis torosa]|uniref:Uncharacterized protein n=1 Tax=Cyprideis torosa TaxID=163714 RepID=A0A7R8ZPZ3_9CRUS|nr:unnamed protein product [Cyprideis torosa]CAG0895121.1 unnamed protein product [Cyprideis torosa]
MACLIDALSALIGKVVRREPVDQMIKFSLEISSIIKLPSEMSSLARVRTENLWIKAEDLICKCPRIKMGRSYLILGKSHRYRPSSGLHINRRSLVFDWRDEWLPKLRRLQEKSIMQCPP